MARAGALLIGAIVFVFVTAASASWIADIAGPCQETRGCVQSAGYDETPRRYGDEDSCVVTTNSSVTVSAVSFTTEKNYDILSVGGLMYSGKITYGPQDVSLDAGSSITWSTDGGTAKGGWKLCPTHLVEQEKELEPAMSVEGLEMFCYAFMTVTTVWMCPFTFLVPLLLTLAFLALKRKKAANRDAMFPIIVFEGWKYETANGDLDDNSSLLIACFCVAYWGVCSLAIVMFVIVIFAGIALGVIYVLGLSVMLAVMMLLNVMESVAKRGLKDSVNNKLEDGGVRGLSQTQSSSASKRSYATKQKGSRVIVLDSFSCRSPNGGSISVHPGWRRLVTKEPENGEWTVAFSLPGVGERLVSSSEAVGEVQLSPLLRPRGSGMPHRGGPVITTVALFLQFIVDAMLVEAGMELLPSGSEGSETPPVFSVATNTEGGLFLSCGASSSLFNTLLSPPSPP